MKTQHNKAVIKFYNMEKQGGARGSVMAMIYDRTHLGGEPVDSTGIQPSFQRCKEVATNIAKAEGYNYIEFVKRIG